MKVSSVFLSICSGNRCTLSFTSQARPGPLETGGHIKPFLQEFCPRFAAMTGICAGDKRNIKLGDLIIAEYAYHYDEGKVEMDGDGGKIHRPELITYGPARRILQYAHNFTAWEAPVADLKGELEGAAWPKCFDRGNSLDKYCQQ